MADLVLYTNPMSRGRIARWMLEEIGAPYEREVVPYGPTGTRSEAFGRINPMGKLPALVHAGTVVTEAAAICAHLADAFPEAGLAPPPAERGAYYRWLFFGAGCVEPALTARGTKREPLPENRATVGYGSVDDTIETLASAVSRGPYVAGPTFSAADVYVGSQIMFALRFALMAPRPEFERYVGPLAAREAYQRATALDDADMAAAQS